MDRVGRPPSIDNFSKQRTSPAFDLSRSIIEKPPSTRQMHELKPGKGAVTGTQRSIDATRQNFICKAAGPTPIDHIQQRRIGTERDHGDAEIASTPAKGVVVIERVLAAVQC